MIIETHDLRHLDADLLRLLTRRFAFSDGWMRPVVRTLLKGTHEGRPLLYSRGYAHVAYEDDNPTPLGWAITRVPERVVKRKLRTLITREGCTYNNISAGRRPDFMVFVDKKHRKKKIARKLLLVAYNNHGKMDVYPHDERSDSFFSGAGKMVVQHNPWYMKEFELREIWK